MPTFPSGQPLCKFDVSNSWKYKKYPPTPSQQTPPCCTAICEQFGFQCLPTVQLNNSLSHLCAFKQAIHRGSILASSQSNLDYIWGGDCRQVLTSWSSVHPSIWETIGSLEIWSKHQGLSGELLCSFWMCLINLLLCNAISLATYREGIMCII